MATKDELAALIQPAVAAAGVDFWGLEFLQTQRSSLLRIYIDHADGVTVEDCARVSHQVSGVLDVADPINGEYRLEVSSPGWDRPLFRAEQYPAYVGQKLKVKTLVPLQGRRQFTGVLESCTGGAITLKLSEDKIVTLDFAQIDKAQVVPDYEAEMRKKN